MRKKLSIAFVCFFAGMTVSLQAQKTVPYIPMQGDFGGTIVTDPADFVPDVRDYTLEVEASGGETITFSGMSYIPLENGTVRFVQKDGKVYVFESGVFQSILTPTQLQLSGSNIIQNPGFEEVEAETLASSRWKPTLWDTWNGEATTWGGGVGETNVREDANYRSEGVKAIIMHSNSRQLLQKLPESSLEAGAYYLLSYDYWTSSGSGNGGITYQVYFKSEKYSGEFQTITGHTTLLSGTQKSSFATLFQVSPDVPETVWFVLQRNESKVDWLDNFKLYKIESIDKGITGINGSLVYLAGAAYAPEDLILNTGDYMDMTSRMTNPEFEGSISNNTPNGWTKTFNPNTSKLSTAVKGDGSVIVAGENHWQVWSGSAVSGKMYQTLSNLPNGKYTVRAGLYSEFGGEISLYANEGSTHAVNKSSAYYETTGTVTNGTLEIGLNIATTGTTTIELDHFTLRYMSPSVISFKDRQSYSIPASFDATVSYTRTFSAEGVTNQTHNGWQSLCLPFDVTGIELEDEYTQTTLDLTEEANRKFWLFRIREGRYEEAFEIEANQYYLIALPNAPDYYIPEINLKGTMKFSGTRVETTALQPIQMNGYSIVADYKKTNTGYGITDENDETVFKQGVCNGAFWPHAVPSGNGTSDLYYVFGTTTSIRPVMDSGSDTSLTEVVAVPGGLEVTVAQSQIIRIFAWGGQLVKSIQIPAGTTTLFLPAGQYIAAGQKVIVND